MNLAYSHNLLIRNLLIRNPGNAAPLFSISLDSLNFTNGPQMIDATPVKHFMRRGAPLMADLFRAASCNGLILVSKGDNRRIWAIWNPLTKESHALPKPDTLGRLRGLGFGYGYHTDDYRVVRIDDMPNGACFYRRTLVYSLKSYSWRMIEKWPYHDFWVDDFFVHKGTFFDGKLYWTSGGGVIALDLKTLPSHPNLKPEFISRDLDFLGRFLNCYVDALDGCLIYTMKHDGRIHGWVMKDDGHDSESLWNKLFDDEGSRLVAYLKSKKQVLVHGGRCFLWLDIESNSAKEINITGHGLPQSSQICPGSLVRLNRLENARDVAATTSTKKRENENEKDIRMRLFVRDLDTSRVGAIVVKKRVGVVAYPIINEYILLGKNLCATENTPCPHGNTTPLHILFNPMYCTGLNCKGARCPREHKNLTHITHPISLLF